MSRIKSRLTVFFLRNRSGSACSSRETDGVICAARVVFGAQPTDAEVFEFVLRHADRLRYGPPVEGRLSRETANPKKTPPRGGACETRPARHRHPLAAGFTACA